MPYSPAFFPQSSQSLLSFRSIECELNLLRYNPSALWEKIATTGNRRNTSNLTWQLRRKQELMTDSDWWRLFYFCALWLWLSHRPYAATRYRTSYRRSGYLSSHYSIMVGGKKLNCFPPFKEISHILWRVHWSWGINSTGNTEGKEVHTSLFQTLWGYFVAVYIQSSAVLPSSFFYSGFRGRAKRLARYAKSKVLDQ